MYSGFFHRVARFLKTIHEFIAAEIAEVTIQLLQMENLHFNDYTAQKLSETWQDDNLLDEIVYELIEALPSEEYYI